MKNTRENEKLEFYVAKIVAKGYSLNFVSTMENLFNSGHTQIHKITLIYYSVSFMKFNNQTFS